LEKDEFMSLIVRTIQARCSALGISQNSLAAYLRVPPNRLSQAFSGARSFDNEMIEHVNSTVSALEWLQESCRPFPLDFRQTSEVLVLLRMLKQGELDETLSNMHESFAKVSSADLAAVVR
jgi:transcriptional regulator with XRE-family HTH domain